MSILSRLCFEVKEIGSKSVAFRNALVRRTLRRFGTCPAPKPVKWPTFNTVISAPELHIIGAVTWGVTHFRPKCQ
jgi:hypothetical protein